jgi:hypothetical protein
MLLVREKVNLASKRKRLDVQLNERRIIATLQSRFPKSSSPEVSKRARRKEKRLSKGNRQRERSSKSVDTYNKARTRRLPIVHSLPRSPV